MREAPYLRHRYRLVAGYVGLIAALTGLLMLVPLLAVLAWPEEAPHAMAFLIPALVLGAAGYALRVALDPGDVVLSLQEGGVIVLLGWLVASLAGAIPLMSLEGLDFTEAVFESVSGWTTTGLSVIDVEKAHPMTLLWRSTMQLAGGAGLAIIMLAAIAGGGGPSLSAAEGRTEQLAPNVLASARLVLRIYAGFVTLGVLGLRAAGMGWFDAVNHAFCALSTGGFSTRTASIGHWDSPGIESFMILLMVLGQMNFITAWLLLRGKLRAFAGNGEVRTVALLVPACAALLLWLTCAPLYSSASKAVRVAVFETVSALTTTGYSTVGYGDWNAFGLLLLMVLMLVGGATCSTAGGMKQQRIYLLGRSLLRELRRPAGPRGAVIDDSTWEGEQTVVIGDARIRAVAVFVFLYLATWLAGTAVIAVQGYGLQESLFEFASALGTVGLSVGITSAKAPDLVLWTETAGMLLGRLEFFIIFAAAAKLFRDARVMLRPVP